MFKLYVKLYRIVKNLLTILDNQGADDTKDVNYQKRSLSGLQIALADSSQPLVFYTAFSNLPVLAPGTFLIPSTRLLIWSPIWDWPRPADCTPDPF